MCWCLRRNRDSGGLSATACTGLCNWLKVGHKKEDGANFFFFNLFLAVLGLRCCAWAFSSCGERGLLFIAVRGLLTAVASLVAEHVL